MAAVLFSGKQAFVSLFSRNVFMGNLCKRGVALEFVRDITSTSNCRFLLNQKYKKIFERDRLSAARFEHLQDTIYVVFVIGQRNSIVITSCLCNWTVRVICARAVM